MLRLVDIVAKVQASQTLLQSEGEVCLSQQIPPVCQPHSTARVVHPTDIEPETPDLDTQPNARKPDVCPNRNKGAGQ